MVFKTSRRLINRKQQREKIANLLTQKGGGLKFDVLEFFGIGELGKSRILVDICNPVIVDRPSNISLHVVSAGDHDNIVNIINTVAGERKYLQTDRYVPTSYWECLLAKGINVRKGLLLMAVKDRDMIIGFARLYPDDEHPLGRRAGNIGLALLRSYRSRGIGAIILRELIVNAVELDYHVLTANILETNKHSRRLFSRCGFRMVRCRDIYLDFLNDHVNELYYEMKLSRSREAK